MFGFKFGFFNSTSLSKPRAFNPAALFAASEPGGWYDPSDLTTLYQDSAGTTPVTAAGQTVGLMLDKSQGLVLGPELFANQSSVIYNSGGGATATHTASSRTVQITAVGTNTGYPRLQVSVGMVAGRRYVVSGRIDGDIGLVTLVRIALIGAANNLSYNASTGVFSGIQEAGATPTLEVHVNGTLTGTVTIATFSVRELPGAHATQATTARRPILAREPLGGRRNLLTYTEQFDNGAWKTQVGGSGSVPTVNTTPLPGPSNGIPAFAVTFNVGAGTASTDFSRFYQDGIQGQTDLVALVASVWMRVQSGTATIVLDIPGTASATQNVTLTTAWQKVSVSGTVAVAVSGISLRARGDLTNGSFTVEISQPQIELGSTATPYQKVVSSSDVTEVGKPDLWFLLFDGTDDFLVTPTITPGTDKAQVFAGVRKLRDAAGGMVAATSANPYATAGAFAVTAPDGASATYGFLTTCGGTTNSGYTAAAVAPHTAVLSCAFDASKTDRATAVMPRVNGSVPALTIAGSTLTAGAFAAHPLYVGRSGGTSLPFNGRLYGLITRFGPTPDASVIAKVESWMNSRTGAY